MNKADFTKRLIAVLPSWFGDHFPNFEAFLQGPAVTAEFINGLSKYVKTQMRLQTMVGNSLDLYSFSMFGNKLPRHAYESDDSYRKRISARLLQPGATRPAMIQMLTSLTGRVPIYWESFTDGGYYGQSFYGHSQYSTNNGAYQAWIIAYRPQPPNFGGISYYGSNFYGHAYYEPSQSNSITDQDILDAIEETKMAGTVMHTTILD